MARTATVKYISNGYTVVSVGQVAIPASLYAATLPEVVYWLGKIFEPYAVAMTANDAPPKSVAPAIVDSSDPLLNQEARVSDLDSGGFIVTQLPSFGTPGVQVKQIETFCANMDAVHDQLTAIFTPPEPVTPE